MELWTAFVIGLVGSLHCIGMCGPIALALPRVSSSRRAMVYSRLLYNAGRIVTYAALGAAAGLFGATISAVGFQQTLSILMGTMLLLAVALPSRFFRRFLPVGVTSIVAERGRTYWDKLFGSERLVSLFGIGLLNGFLPCGLVYVAMAAAAVAGGISSSILYMVMFGLGTTPVMLVTALSGNLIGMRLRRSINRLMPIGGLLLAIVLILRGLSLGIPYISPDLQPGQEISEQSHCH
ncbi:MAG: sulfite exporter TauE/SafE family protein [Planctomycetota bacterium]